MTNKQFLTALLILVWMLSFCTLAVTALIGADAIAMSEHGNPNASKWVFGMIAVCGGISVLGLGQILKGIGE